MSTILVMEDDPISRTLLSRVFEDAGFKVLMAEDGAKGVELFRQAPASIDLVILDMLMPNLNGDDALRLIRDERPDIPAVVSTGCSIQDVENALADLEVAEIFYKPYSIRELIKQVTSLLDT